MVSTLDGVREVLRKTLDLGARADDLEPETRLLGSLPEMDSIAVTEVILELEDHFDIYFDDEEISAEMFETVRALSDYVEKKMTRTGSQG